MTDSLQPSLPPSARARARLRHALTPRRALVVGMVVLLPVIGLGVVATGQLPERPCDLRPDPASEPPATSSVDRIATPHVMIVVFENHEACSVLATDRAPFLERTARTYGLATQSYGRLHPSFPNYLELIAGTTFGVTENCDPCMVEGRTIVDQLDARGIGWKAYMEGAPEPCFAGYSTPDGYVKRHNPFMHVTHIAESPRRCNRVVPLTELEDDLRSGSAPPFLWVTPNLCHQGHDCSITTADRWLSQFLPEVQRSSWYREGGIVILTWDEGITNAGCCGGAKGGHIPTIVVAEHARGARLDSPITHAGVLRGIQKLYDVPFLAKARCACSGDLFPLLEDTTADASGTGGPSQA